MVLVHLQWANARRERAAIHVPANRLNTLQLVPNKPWAAYCTAPHRREILTCALNFNHANTDKAFRQAVTYAINRPEIIEKVLGGLATLNYTIPPGFKLYDDINKYDYDVDKAKALLETSKMKGKKVRLWLLAEDPFEILLRVDGGVETVLRIELERAHQPRAKAGGQRLETAPRGVRPRGRDDIAQPSGRLFVEQRPAEDQRQRDDGNLRDVRAVIESRLGRRTGNRDPQLFPVPLGREAQFA